MLRGCSAEGSADFHTLLNANSCLCFPDPCLQGVCAPRPYIFYPFFNYSGSGPGWDWEAGVTTGRKLRKAGLLEEGRHGQGRQVNCDVEGLVPHHKDGSRPGQLFVQVTFGRWAPNHVSTYLSRVHLKIGLKGCVAR